MNWLFNLLYWSTSGTKGTWCCAAGRRRAQVMQFQAISAGSPVPRNRHHDWPHSALTQQPQHPEERRQSSDEAQKKHSPRCPRRKHYLWPKDWWIQHHLHLPCCWRRPWVMIFYCVCICAVFLFWFCVVGFGVCLLVCWFVVWFFSRREGERQGSCTKAGNTEEEMKMSGADMMDVRMGGTWIRSAMQNLSLCFSNIWRGHTMQRNAQTGLSFLWQFAWHTAHVSVKMLCMPCGAEIILW